MSLLSSHSYHPCTGKGFDDGSGTSFTALRSGQASMAFYAPRRHHYSYVSLPYEITRITGLNLLSTISVFGANAGSVARCFRLSSAHLVRTVRARYA
jgi:hypothetical protein